MLQMFLTLALLTTVNSVGVIGGSPHTRPNAPDSDRHIDLPMTFEPDATGLSTIPARIGDRKVHLAVMLDNFPSQSCVLSDVAAPSAKTATVSFGRSMSFSVLVLPPSNAEAAALRAKHIDGYIASDLLKNYSFGFDLPRQILRIWREPKVATIQSWVAQGKLGTLHSLGFDLTSAPCAIRMKWQVDGKQLTFGFITGVYTSMIRAADTTGDVEISWGAGDDSSKSALVWEKNTFGAQWNLYEESSDAYFVNTSGVNGIVSYADFSSCRSAISGVDHRIYFSPVSAREHAVYWLSQILALGVVPSAEKVIYDPSTSVVVGIDKEGGASKESHGGILTAVNGVPVDKLIGWVLSGASTAADQLKTFIESLQHGRVQLDLIIDGKAQTASYTR